MEIVVLVAQSLATCSSRNMQLVLVYIGVALKHLFSSASYSISIRETTNPRELDTRGGASLNPVWDPKARQALAAPPQPCQVEARTTAIPPPCLRGCDGDRNTAEKTDSSLCQFAVRQSRTEVTVAGAAG
jgi:hypothetical protein